MVDAHASGACEVIHGGSSPLLGTLFFESQKIEKCPGGEMVDALS